jgi:hypothetical protein
VGVFSWLFSKAAAGVIESTGEAITKVVRVTKGDKAAVQEHIHDEQMATLSEHASEFVSRPTRTKWDSFIDGLNRLPRPLIVLWVCVFFVWPFFGPESFLQYVLSMELIPDSLWMIFLTILGFYFGGRVISQDIKPPRLSEAQRDYALRQIEKREKAIIEARTPLIVEVAPTRKPEAPPWTREVVLDKPKIPVFKPDPIKPPKIIKGRPAEVDAMIAALIDREGGFVHDSADSGGATRYGITISTLSAWRGGEVTVDDVKKLTKAEAADIYAAEYWLKPGIDSLPIGLMAHTMDAAVNCGPRTGVKMLQQALNSLGAGIREDGLVGPATRSACQKYPEAEIHNKLVDVRVKFYKDLAARRGKDRKFLRGWLLRAESFRVK